MKSSRLELKDNEVARALSGARNAHLKQVEKRLGVKVGQRGALLVLTGPEEKVEEAREVLKHLAAGVEAGEELHPEQVEAALRTLHRDGHQGLAASVEPVLARRFGRHVAPRGLAQKRYVELIARHDVVFGIGPAGTGKTYLAMAMAVAALQERRVKRIVLARPAVEAGEKLGFLPGDLAEKVNPYLRPLYDALHDMMDARRAQELLEEGVVEVAPLAFMRGRTLNDAFAILDEAQNTSVEQMKMFLTRLGHHSRAVVTGDVTQIDLPPGKPSGLVHARKVLQGVAGVGFAEFSAVDVVRAEVVQAIVRAYEGSDGEGGKGHG